ncbi:uncharacterized protein KGF55_002816 [Candida pseudojiufengensis]|uniref:uncharacterized protein n=1 Tax=Candida pseudojiufengensis TaxID=497109 RepID=UPI002224E55A|nr:uncharacterized protein KGF55_002816 [Candida pseudojiufengensis]KAI5963024.1 hypothetical protein KGF55_002816 [Candida pseudojiufengensis]
MSFRHLLPVIIIRTALIIPFFILGCLSIVFTQWTGLIIFKNTSAYKEALINKTKTHFLILIGWITSIVNPSKVAITLDINSIPNAQQFKVDDSNNLHTMFQPNSILISNHQIYTDWLFLWFLTYTSKMSDFVFIILKDLSKIPVLGYGMKNFNFLFLSRKWEKDKIILTNQLLKIDANGRGKGPANGFKLIDSTEKNYKKWPQGNDSSKIWPYELLLFPEGTVPSDRTTKKSAEYVLSKGYPPLKHVLLPRVRGLYLALQKLRGSLEIVYDITTAYSGLKEDEYGEILFSLKRFYIKGYGPPVINYYIKGFKIDDIPLGDEIVDDIDDASPETLQKFEEWLLEIWYEKDKLMNNFYKTGKWGVDSSNSKLIVGDFKMRNSFEIFKPFLVVLSAILIIYSIIRIILSLI